MALADGVFSELDMEAAATRRVLERVPESQLAWKPHEKSSFYLAALDDAR
jgi:hypothetical protein